MSGERLPLFPERPGLAASVAAAVRSLSMISDDRDRVTNLANLAQASEALRAIAVELRGDMSGRDAIREALTSAYPNGLSGVLLREVSGIQEYARRVRELRVEEGFDIERFEDGYRLRSPEPDSDAAKRWELLNQHRNLEGSASDRLRALFVQNLGVIFTTADITDVGGISSAPRRVRELRTEEGWRIESHKDNPALRPGEYVLIDPEPIPGLERIMSARLRRQVLERDGHACVSCGRGPDPHLRIWLEVDHIVPLEAGGQSELDNLRTLCNECHRARDASRS